MGASTGSGRDRKCARDGGAVGLTDNPSALRRWMVAGPEVVRLIEKFHDETDSWNKPPDTRHHDQSASVQSAFVKDSF